MYEKINRFELYKEMYHKELEKQDTLSNQFISNLGLLTFIAAALTFCIKNVNDILTEKYFTFFVLNVSWAIICIIILIVLNFFFLPADTHVVASPQVLEDYHQDIIKSYNAKVEATEDEETKKKLIESAEETIEKVFSKGVFDLYVEATTLNTKMNIKKQKVLSLSNVFLLCTIVATFLALSCYVPTFFKTDANVQKVEVVKTKTVDEKKE